MTLWYALPPRNVYKHELAAHVHRHAFVVTGELVSDVLLNRCSCWACHLLMFMENLIQYPRRNIIFLWLSSLLLWNSIYWCLTTHLGNNILVIYWNCFIGPRYIGTPSLGTNIYCNISALSNIYCIARWANQYLLQYLSSGQYVLQYPSSRQYLLQYIGQYLLLYFGIYCNQVCDWN